MVQNSNNLLVYCFGSLCENCLSFVEIAIDKRGFGGNNEDNKSEKKEIDHGKKNICGTGL